MSASGKKVRAFSQSATQKARMQVSLLSIGSICRVFFTEDRSHAPRGNAASDAPRHAFWDAERPGRHSHAERGNDQRKV
ncbi:hypothetical protein DOZ69_04925 [Pseudomonas fluorescens]|nr:hypothetical protein DOZ69_04925 [Pseudomonas fluorescens]